MLKIVFIILTLCISFILLQENVPSVKSSVSSCSVTLDTHELDENSTVDLNFTITNTDANDYHWVRITAPNSEYEIVGISAANWAKDYSATQASFTNGTLSSSDSQIFNLTISTNNASSSQSWTVQVSDDGDGAGAISCSGDTSTSIGSVGETLSIDEISTSSLSSSSITISWTTNLASTGVLDYGTTTSYGSSVSSSTSSTSHSVTLTGLSADTTFHYRITASSGGNDLQSSDYTFTTAELGSTSSSETITVTTTVTNTKLVTPTPTPTPIPDRTPPRVVVTTDLSKPFVSSPKMAGVVEDLRSLIQKVEYSLDGENWIKVEIGETPRRKVVFEFQPEFLEDGNYELLVRATENAGNIGYSEKTTLVIDRLPPMVGGNLFSVGPQVINPTEAGYIRTIVHVPLSMAMSAVGGPIEINFFSGGSSFPLRKARDTGLWFGELSFDKPGFYQIISTSTDGAGNFTKQELNYVEVINGGKIVNNAGNPIEHAKIEVFYKDFDSQLWVSWNGNSYEQKNPQITNKNGEFSSLLPPGTYYVKVQADGYRSIASTAFIIDTPTTFNPVISLQDKKGIWIGKFFFSLPQLLDDSVEISLPKSSQLLPSFNLIDSDVPNITLRGTEGQVFDPIRLRGTKNIISFIGLWSPPSIEQFVAFEEVLVGRANLPISIIAVQETSTKAKLFLERGNYKSTLFVDPDGETIAPYGIYSYPSNYVVDKSGKVISIIRRVLSKEEIIKILEN
ncbi:MAG TPA: fibronectin type III domain-containing protein [Patescibacteria group bacterium]|nr:fibronectin type III domain-containing protein [Patescibacteria group bacterium]